MESEQTKRLVEALTWAMRYIDDGLEFNEEGGPIHECEFTTNPLKGECLFCNFYWEAKELLSPAEPLPNEGMKEHPEGYEGPCACDSCKHYAN